MDNSNEHIKIDKQKDENLRGTFVTVLFIGGIILLTWLLVFYMYLKVTFV